MALPNILRNVRWKKYLIPLLLFVVTSTAIAVESAIPMKLKQSVCGIKEPIYFWLWSAVAGRPNSKRLSGLDGVVDLSFKTQDGRTLRGYKLGASPHFSQPQPCPRIWSRFMS